MKRLGWILVSIFSLGLTALAAQLIIKEWYLTWILIVSIIIHELGHMITLRIFGISSNLIFIPLLGAATVPNEDLDSRPWSELGTMSLMGPFATVLLVIIGLVIYFAWDQTWGLKMASLNASLAVFNLIPLGIFDGGHITEALFNSLKEDEDTIVADLVSIVSLIVTIILLIVGKSLFLFHMLIWWSIRRKSGQDDPDEAYSWRAMTSDQAILLLAVYLMLLFGSVIASAFLPYWLAK